MKAVYTKKDFIEVLIDRSFKERFPYITFPFPLDQNKKQRPIELTRISHLQKNPILPLLNKLTSTNVFSILNELKQLMETNDIKNEMVIDTIINMVKRFKKGEGEEPYFSLVSKLGIKYKFQYIQSIIDYIQKNEKNTDEIKTLDCINLHYILAKRTTIPTKKMNRTISLDKTRLELIHSHFLAVVEISPSLLSLLLTVEERNRLKRRVEKERGKIRFLFYDIWECCK